MSKLPAVTARQAIKAFGRAGFVHCRVKGAHHVLKKQGHPYLLTVPDHGGRALRAGTLRQLIRGAGLTVEQFNALLDEL